jgi:peptidoglycan-associated lipoprotein
MRKNMRYPVILFCVLSLFISSCGKKKNTSEDVVSTSPGNGSTSVSGDFDPLEGQNGVSVIGKDIPFGDRQPDMDRYFDPNYNATTGDSTGDSLTDPSMGSSAAPGSINDSADNMKVDLSTIFRTIYFALDKHNLPSGGFQVLSNIADFLRENESYSLVVEGHCDERGSNAYNLALGEKRALSVREYLASLGINAGRIHTVSFGE